LMARAALVSSRPSIYQRQDYWQARTKHALLIAAKLEHFFTNLERSCLLD
jgi:hypothetical protein